MSAYDFETLSVHVGHEIEVVFYGRNFPDNVACECITCGSVLVDFDRSPLFDYKIKTGNGVRIWQAEDAKHAREQHNDAFPDESIIRVWKAR